LVDFVANKELFTKAYFTERTQHKADTTQGVYTTQGLFFTEHTQHKAYFTERRVCQTTDNMIDR